MKKEIMIKMTIQERKTAFTRHASCGVIENIAKRHPELFSDLFSLSDFSYQVDGKQIFLTFREISSYTIDTGSNSFLDALICFVDNVIVKNKINPVSAYHVIDLAVKDLPEKERNDLCECRRLFSLFSLLQWPSSSKGVEYYQEFPKFSEGLIQYLEGRKISLNEAFLFHMALKTNGIFSYDFLWGKWNLTYSYSENNQILKSLAEIAKRKEEDFLDLLSRLDFSLDFKTLWGQLQKKRYPYYTRTKKIFDTYLEDFHLPPGTTILPAPFFEKNEYLLQVKFKDRNSLTKKITVLEKSLGRLSQATDFFQTEELFSAGKKREEEKK